NGPGMMRRSGKEQHEVGLQLTDQPGIEVQRFNLGKPVAMKCNEVKSAECRCEFVLAANLAAQNTVRNMERTLREVILGERLIQVGRQRLEDVHTYTGRGAQARSRGYFRGQEEVHTDIARDLLKRRERNLQSATLNFHGRNVAPGLKYSQVR